MNRLIIFSLSMAICASALQAMPLSPDEAMERISSSSSKKAKAIAPSSLKLKKTVKASSGREAIYLFSSDSHTLVLPGSDNVAPLLGYIDSNFDVDEMPDGLEYWLRYMAEEVEYSEQSGTVAVSVPSVGAAISPLLPTRWGQTGAYNIYTPVVNEKQSPSGCVATALAQIMYYHKWPLNPVGSASCTDSNKTEYSMDFDGITFEWEKMTTSYAKDDTTSEAADAVATLMKAVGYGVNMEYGPYGSGATDKDAVNGMVNYFGYSSNLESVRREIFTRGEWEEMLYKMLSAGQPIYYTGRDAVWIGSGGHAFVCDGYDGDGYFHFNWGWDGAYNGYFLTSCMVPEGAGTGGYINGYSYSQAVMTNLYPDNGQVTPTVDYVRGVKFDYSNVSKSITASFERYPSSSLAYEAALAVTPVGNALQAADLRDVKQVGGEGSISATINAAFTQDLDTSTDYAVRVVWREDASDSWKRVTPPIAGLVVYYPKEFGGVLRYVDNQWTFSAEILDIDPYDITVNDLKFNDDDYLLLNQDNDLKMTFTNNDDDYFHHPMRMYFVDTTTGEKPKFLNFSLDMKPGETLEQNFTLSAFKGIPVGQYYAEFTEAATRERISMDTSKVYNVYDETSLPTVADGTFTYQIMPKGFAVLLNTVTGEPADGDITLPAYVEYEGKDLEVRSFAKEMKALISIETIKSLNIQTHLKEIAPYQFQNCKLLESLQLPEGLTTIGYFAFHACNELKSLTIPAGVDSIASFAFGSCYKLESLTLSEGLRVINPSAFSGVRELKQLVLPEGLEVLGDRAFCYCYALTDVTLPSTLKSVGNRVFNSFYNTLRNVTCSAATPPELHEAAFTDNNYANATLSVPVSAYNSYVAHPVWGKFANIEADESLTTGIEGISDDISLVSIPQGIEILNAAGKEIAIYSANGMTISRFKADSDYLQCSLPSGLYIINIDDNQFKILIK